MGQQSRPGYTAFDGPRRSRRLHDAVTLRAAQLRPHMANHEEARGHILQHLAEVFAQLTQCTAAIRARRFLRFVPLRLTRQMIG